VALNEIGYGSADLVVFVDDNGTVKPFIVIELESNPSSVSSKKAVEQARSYAKALNAPFYVIACARYLRLFKNPEKGINIGDYEISLAENFARKFLEEIAAIYEGRINKLSFKELDLRATAEPSQKIKQLLEELEMQGIVKLERRPVEQGYDIKVIVCDKDLMSLEYTSASQRMTYII